MTIHLEIFFPIYCIDFSEDEKRAKPQRFNAWALALTSVTDAGEGGWKWPIIYADFPFYYHSNVLCNPVLILKFFPSQNSYKVFGIACCIPEGESVYSDTQTHTEGSLLVLLNNIHVSIGLCRHLYFRKIKVKYWRLCR